jgi:hypothetical protein
VHVRVQVNIQSSVGLVLQFEHRKANQWLFLLTPRLSRCSITYQRAARPRAYYQPEIHNPFSRWQTRLPNLHYARIVVSFSRHEKCFHHQLGGFAATVEDCDVLFRPRKYDVIVEGLKCGKWSSAGEEEGCWSECRYGCSKAIGEAVHRRVVVRKT